MSRYSVANVGRQSAVVFLASLAVQLAAFIVLAFSGYTLEIDAFATLSLISSACIVLTSLLDFGMNLTMTKFYSETNDDVHLRRAFGIRLVLLGIALAIGGVLIATVGSSQGLALIYAGVFNIWNGARATDQARQDFGAFARSSLSFAAIRIFAGLIAIICWPDPRVIAAALYVVPVVVVFWRLPIGKMRGAFRGFEMPASDIVKYALAIHIGQLLFVAICYVPQFLIEARLPSSDVARYGIILTFSAPLPLAITSVRNVLLPKMLNVGSNIEDQLWSWRGALAIAILWMLLMLAGGLATWLVDLIYGGKFPSTAVPYLIFYAGIATTGAIGFLSLSIHSQNLPHYAAIVSTARMVILGVALAMTGNSLIAVVTITALVLVLGEICLALALHAARTRA